MEREDRWKGRERASEGEGTVRWKGGKERKEGSWREERREGRAAEREGRRE